MYLMNTFVYVRGPFPNSILLYTTKQTKEYICLAHAVAEKVCEMSAY